MGVVNGRPPAYNTLMASSQRPLLAWVEREVRRARPIALRSFRTPHLRIHRKADASPVTVADRAVEDRLRTVIARRCPGERIIGEEFGASGPSSDAYWLIDPIDGTRAFSRGLPTWSILIARVERGIPTLGLCDFPALGITLGVAPGVRAYERQGGQARLLPRPRASTISDMVLLHGGSAWWQRTAWKRGFARLARACYLERAYGDAYGYLWALRGYADAVIDCGVKPWDLGALYALAFATGRALVNFENRPSFSGPDSIMAPPPLARRIAQALTHG